MSRVWSLVPAAPVVKARVTVELAKVPPESTPVLVPCVALARFLPVRADCVVSMRIWYEVAGSRPSNRKLPLASVVTVPALVDPLNRLSTTPAIPASPASWMPLLLASSNTRSPTWMPASAGMISALPTPLAEPKVVR